MEFSRQEYWSGLPFPTPRDLPNPRIEASVSCVSPALAGGFFTTVGPGQPKQTSSLILNNLPIHPKSAFIWFRTLTLHYSKPELILRDWKGKPVLYFYDIRNPLYTFIWLSLSIKKNPFRMILEHTQEKVISLIIFSSSGYF